MVYDLFDRGLQYEDDGSAKVTTAEANYARQASISYVQVGSIAGYFSNAFDNNNTTFWRMNGNSASDSDITLDFISKKTFTSIFIEFQATVTDGAADTVFSFNLQGKTLVGDSWTTIETINKGQGDTTTVSLYAYGQNYRYLRIYSTRTAGNGTALLDMYNFGVYK